MDDIVNNPTVIAHQIKTLGEIAEIRSGMHFRGSIKHDPKGFVRIIQLKDIKKDATIDYDGATRIHRDPPLDGNLHLGDILFRARGKEFSAVMFKPHGRVSFASSHFLVVRARGGGMLLQSYVTWYINQAAARRFFAERSVGSSTQLITAKDLKELPIVLPTGAQQKRIVTLSELQKRERELTEQILEKHTQVIDAAINKVLSLEQDK